MTNCQYCGGMGYIVVAGSDGNPEQEQCEYCYINWLEIEESEQKGIE